MNKIKPMQPDSPQLVHFTCGLNPKMGGIPTSIRELSVNLNQFGLKSVIFSIGNSPGAKYLFEPEAEQIRVAGNILYQSFSAFWNPYGVGLIPLLKMYRLNIQEKSRQVIVLHQVYTLSTLYGYLYARLSGRSYMIFPHGSLTNYHEEKSQKRKAFVKKLFISRILDHADAILCTSTGEKKDLASSLRIKAYVIPYGAIVRRSKRDGGFANLNNETPNVLFAGRFDKKKNLNLLIKSWVKVIEKFPRAILNIAGSGTEEENRKIESLIATLNLDNSVIIHGWVDSIRLRDLMLRNSLLVLPSFNENFGLVITEALSLGIPCLVSEYVGLADIIKKHGAGKVLDKLDSDSIASGIIEILGGDSKKFEMLACRALSCELDWKKVAQQWRDLIALIS